MYRSTRILLQICTYISGGLPHVCGSSYDPSDECWRYDPSNDSWTMTATAPRAVHFAARAFSEEWGVIMSGGYNDDGSTETVTLTKTGGKSTGLLASKSVEIPALKLTRNSEKNVLTEECKWQP